MGGGERDSRVPLLLFQWMLLFLLQLFLLVGDQVVQVVPTYRVDDIFEIHQVGPVHKYLDHEDENMDDDFARKRDQVGQAVPIQEVDDIDEVH